MKRVGIGKAVRARCLECAEKPFRTVRMSPQVATVKDCEHLDCGLYPFRMGHAPRGSGSRVKGIRHYCLWCCKGQASEVQQCPATGCPLWPLRVSKKRAEAGAK